MNKRLIERFFTVLSRELGSPARVILTGGAAGALNGGARPSLDVDFSIRPLKKGRFTWEEVERAVAVATRETGLAANMAEDIDRWGMVSLMDYESHARLYKTFGALALHVLDPAYWSIGKVTRYLDSDIIDLVAVFRRQKTPWMDVVAVWGRSLKASPKSTQLRLFYEHAQAFFTAHGRAVWGKAFNASAALIALRKAAGMPAE